MGALDSAVKYRTDLFSFFIGTSIYTSAPAKAALFGVNQFYVLPQWVCDAFWDLYFSRKD